MQKRTLFLLWLAVIFFVGLASRIYLAKYTYIFGFDSYWFARMASYIIRYGHLPQYDPLSFRGYEPVPLQWEMSMNFPAWAYKLIYGDHYVRQNLLEIFKWMPAVFGAIGSVITGLIGFAVGGPFVGVLAGYFAATNPGYIYRTLSGFFEDDATAFILVLGVLFSLLAYSARDRKRTLIWGSLAAVTYLLAAISWKGFYILPYTFVVFLGLWVAYYVALYLSRFFASDSIRKYEVYFVAGVSALAAMIGGYFVKALAMKEAGDALYLVGALSMTTVYTLALSYISIAFWGVFAASAVIALRRKSRTYAYVAAGTLGLALLTVLSASGHDISLVITMPDGTDVARTYALGSYGAALLGSALLILVAQLAGALAAFLFPDGGDPKFAIDWKILAVFLIPLLFAALSCPINGYCWFSGVTSTIDKILFPPEVQTTTGDVVKPYQGFIEPLTGGPMSRIIGEETVGFMNWPAKYGILFVLIFFSIPFLAYRVKEDRRHLLLLAWLALTWWAAWYKLKFAYYLGVPIAIATAVMLGDLWKLSKRAGRAVAATFAAFLLVVSVSMAATGIFHTVSKVPTLITSSEAKEMYPFGAQPADDYLELFKWIDANTPADANLLNWWSIGHWLTFFTDRGVMTDNTNARLQADIDAAQFFLFDENTSYSIAKKRHMNYVIVESSLLWGAPSLAIYAYGIPNLDDPRLRNFYAFTVNCTPSNSPIYKNKYICFNNQGALVAVVDSNVFAAIPPFGPGFYQETNSAVKLVIGDKNYVVYRGGQRVVNGHVVDALLALTPKLNDSTLVKMLLHAPMEHFKYMWTSKNQRILVYKIE